MNAGRSAGLPLLLVLVLANLLDRDPIQNLRPEVEPLAWHRTSREEQLSARSWQDPLEVAYEAYPELREQASQPGGKPLWTVADLGRQLALERADPACGRVVLLPVFVRGGSWLENAERRIRSRYAVTTGLHRQGFHARDEQHLGLCVYHAPPDPSPALWATPGRGADDLVLPFEWYRRAMPQGGHRSALVVWMDEEAFRGSPLGLLQKVLDQLRTADADLRVGSASVARLDIRAIGPTSSSTLIEMLREDDRFADSGSLRPEFRAPDALRGGESWLRQTELYSVWSTLDFDRERSMRDLAARAGGPGREPVRWRCGLRLRRMIGTDASLADRLVTELRLRRPCRELASSTPKSALVEGVLAGVVRPVMIHDERQILIVAEADSQYGRSWAKYFAGHGHVRLLEFLRGVDGQVPGRKAWGLPDGMQDSVAHEELASGGAQLDYLRRLEDQLDAEEAHCDAIGIFGSDVYDKLALLDLLSHRYPHAVFFTTDLDARLLPTDLTPQTRNLLVASHYDLELPTADAPVPGTAENAPFRSGYQTALCLATIRAVSEPGELRLLPNRPRVFEISRSGAHDLRTPANFTAVDAGRFAWLRWMIASCIWSLLLVFSLCGITKFRGQVKRLLDWIRTKLQSQSSEMPRQPPSPAPAPPAPSKEQDRIRRPRLEAAFGLAVLAVLLSFVGHGSSAYASDLGQVQPDDLASWTWEKRGAVASVALALLIVWLLHPVQAGFKSLYHGLEHSLGRVALGLSSLLVVALLLRLVQLVIDQNNSATGEPFRWVSGISVWPTAIVRLLVAVFCWVAIQRAWRCVSTLRADVGRHFPVSEQPPFDDLRKRLGWSGLFVKSTRKQKPDSFREHWNDYRAVTEKWPRLMRVFGYSVSFYLLCAAMFSTLGTQGSPTRGWSSYLADRLLEWMCQAALIVLLFVVADVFLSLAEQLRSLRHSPRLQLDSGWLKQFARHLRLRPGVASEVARVELVQVATEPVLKFLYPPAIAMGLLLFSRARIFDDWNWSPALGVVFALSFGMLLISAFSLGAASKGIKADALARLTQRAQREHADEAREREVQAALARIRGMQGGALASVTSHPIIRVLLLPFAGLGATSLLEFLAPFWLSR